MKSGTQALSHGTFDLRMHMQARHSVQNMQMSQGPARPLLTALEVQELLHIDRSTVYRMAEDGRLPAIRVGRSWRFPADRIEAMLDSGPPDGESGHPSPSLALGTGAPALSVVPEPALERGPDPRDLDATATLDPTLNTDAASAAVEVAADLLGVMMVVTDMHGQPVTGVANPSTWFSAHAEEPEVLDACVTEWRDLADHPDFTPRFHEGALGFQCARAFIRHGSTLVGMVLAGGVSPSTDVSVDPDLYHLDDAARRRVLDALPRIAAAISTTAPRPAATIPVPHPAATTKEN
jgi:excisionase family DNA binding protein